MTVRSEQPFFFGPSAAPLFGVLHAPEASAGREPFAVLSCAPFAHENGFAHRMQVEWARALAALGAFVLRFDYRGHGDAAGEFEDFTLDHWQDDVLAAIAELERRSRAPLAGLIGLRLGATLAARGARLSGRDPWLVLLEPIISGDKYLDEILRVVMSKDVAHGGGKPRTRAELRAVLSGGGEVVLEGHRLTGAAYASLTTLDILKEPAPTAGPSLIVQLPTTRTAAPRKDLEQLRAHLATRGESEVRLIPTPSLYWGPLTREFDARNRPRAVLDETVAWIRGRLDRPAPRPPKEAPDAPAIDAPAEPDRERPIAFDVAGTPVFGMLHPAKPRPAADGLAAGLARAPVIVLLPQGMNRRTGWNRLYVRMARALAEHGYTSLRFDARGFGDSAGLVELATGEDVFVAVQKGLHVEDSKRAIAIAREQLDDRPIVLVGVCGGAVTAGFLLPDDPRLAAAAMIETELTYTTLVQQEEPAYRLLDKLRSLEKWKRVLTLKADYRKHLRSLASMARRRLARRRAASTEWLADALGPTVNRPLFDAFIRGFERRVPMLFVFGSTENDKAYRQVAARLLAASPHTRRFVRDRTIEGADHDFLQDEHARALISLLVDWLDDPSQPWADPRHSGQARAEKNLGAGAHAESTRPHHP